MGPAQLATLLEVCGLPLFLLLGVIWPVRSVIQGRRPAAG